MKKQRINSSVPYDKVDSEIFVSPPVANISLWSEKFQKWLNVEAIIDSGATISIFPYAFIKNLGINLDDCLLRLMAKSNGAQATYIYKNQKIRLGKLESTVPVAFDKDVYRPLLGGKAVYQLVNVSLKDLPEDISRGEIQEMKKLIAKDIPDINKKLEKLLNKFSRQKAKEMKPEEGKAEYELLSSGKKRKPLTVEKAEAIRDKKGIGRGIFIDDERKDVFVGSKYAVEFKDLMYAMLVHFVTNAGVGGNNETLYIGVWGDSVTAERNRDDAIQQAIRRFRRILNKYGLGKVPELSKSRYAASKTYVIKPKPSYCILRKIEKEKENGPSV